MKIRYTSYLLVADGNHVKIRQPLQKFQTLKWARNLSKAAMKNNLGFHGILILGSKGDPVEVITREGTAKYKKEEQK